MPNKDEKDLRFKARNAIRTKAFPHHLPDHTFGGPGSGSPCPICGLELAADDMVFDLEFDTAGHRPANFQLHVRCFAAWELEREQFGEQDDLHMRASAPTLTDGEREPSPTGDRQ
jgi:hypothetical protein